MTKILFCTRCLNANTRPNILFDEEGVCPPCRFHRDTTEIDWGLRKRELEKVIAFGRQNSSSGYECIVGVSGGKDSTRQALYVKDHLKMKPLLISLNYPPEQLSERGANNISNLISHGFDCINIGCGPRTWRDLMKLSFFKFGNWCKSTELALFSSVPRLAVAYQIPLIFWGESAASALGDLGVLGETEYDLINLKYSNTLAGGDISWLLESGRRTSQLLQYTYPTDSELERARIRIVSLAYFWKEFTALSNGTYSALRGLEIRNETPDDIGEPLGVSMLDEDFMIVNMMIKYYKFGFGRANDFVNEEIRHGRLTRAQAIAFVERYDGCCSPELIDRFCQYIAISLEQFWTVVDSFANKSLFRKIAQGRYERLYEVGQTA